MAHLGALDGAGLSGRQVFLKTAKKIGAHHGSSLGGRLDLLDPPLDHLTEAGQRFGLLE